MGKALTGELSCPCDRSCIFVCNHKIYSNEKNNSNFFCSGDHKQKFYWGHKEILIPVYKNMADCMKKHSKADVLVSFASLRSAYESTVETMQYPQVGVKWVRKCSSCIQNKGFQMF